MRIQVVTLFPDEFRPLVGLGVTGRAIEAGTVKLELLNPRDFARDRHRTVDDRPYGGVGLASLKDLVELAEHVRCKGVDALALTVEVDAGDSDPVDGEVEVFHFVHVHLVHGT